MGLVRNFSNYQNFIKNNNIIPDFAREYKNEYLFIRGIDKTCGKFIKKLDMDGKIFNSLQANKLVLFFRKFLKYQKIEYLKDINDLYLKEWDVRFLDSLEFQLEDYTDLYCDPDSYEFDQEKYDNNIENDYPGFKEFIECFKLFKDKLKIEYIDEEHYKKMALSVNDSDDGIDSDDFIDILDSDFDSDSDDGIDSDDFIDIIYSDSD